VESGPSREGNDDDSKRAIQVDPPHLRHRSHKTIAGNTTVREQYSSGCLLLVVSSVITVTSAVPDPVQEVLHPNTSGMTTADENKSSWKLTASAAVRLLLRGVRESADVFGPLKHVAGGLCFILENCEV